MFIGAKKIHRRKKGCIFGFDFPFATQKDILQKKFEVGNWESFVRCFYEKCSKPVDFREACRRISSKPEKKRVTDYNSNTPFSPYNIRVYYQTFYGIHDIIYPLLKDDKIRVLPMQTANWDLPWIIEICPASRLKMLYKQKVPSYKGDTHMHSNNRIEILDKLLVDNLISIPEEIRSTAIKNNGGDALDSIIAAYSTFCAWQNHFEVEINENYDIEGYVFA